jgi:hypothetical protein
MEFRKFRINITANYEDEIVIEDKDGINLHRKLYCKITGEVEGFLEIEIRVNGIWQTIVSENGKINFLYNADWDSDDFIIKVIPNDNVDGYLEIEYRIISF